ncbi:hypothetical protein [Alkalicoccus daliensis]|uniref:GNAT family N-acetyltransferase n=1 Tax=Alkalicoccus daliensis TaxID=745820 RepID=A0A1H0AM41_9BACI|nr:hypothetical protein [Alkalicoccus daliensis]SDN34203.1 hypothetical protein SAMN04488053_101532 [Alkalicoccus daliensis]
MQTAFLMDAKETKEKETIIQEYENLEMQLLRLQNNLKEIAKHYNVVGVEQTKEDSLLILYTSDNGEICRFMAHECNKPFQGHWDFSIHASYKEDCLHIDDIRGEADKGFGSVCIQHLKDYIKSRNVPFLTGNISPRDWGHSDRLIHFYQKHNFHIHLNESEQSGEIYWENK